MDDVAYSLVQLLLLLFSRLSDPTGILSDLSWVQTSELRKLCHVEEGVIAEERTYVELPVLDLDVGNLVSTQILPHLVYRDKHVQLCLTRCRTIADESELLELVVYDARERVVVLHLECHCYLLCHIFGSIVFSLKSVLVPPYKCN